MAEFFRVGYQRNEKMLFLRQVSTQEEVIQHLEEGGFENIREIVAKGQFAIKHYTESYLVNGEFEPDTMMENLGVETDNAVAEGYTALRATGEMSWVYMEENLTDKLIKYESLLNDSFPDRFAGICMYDTRIFEPGVMLKILSTHPQAIIKRKLFHNIYYMPPDEFLGPNVEHATLSRWMNNIQERHRVEEQLIASKLEAEKAVQAKASFLATMSHEIRNPVNGIIGSVDMLAHTPVAEEQKDYVNIIQSSAKHLYTVVNDVLDFSKIENGKMELSMAPLQLSILIRDAINLCQYSTQKNLAVSLKSDVHSSCPNFIIGDETRLRQILVNLIGNACKFTDEGQVVVSVIPLTQDTPSFDGAEPVTKDKIWLEFSVADSGNGIAPVDQARLFQRFTQIDVTRKWAGTGLGLAICKQLVEAMNGQIFVKSVIGQGSTFSFRVPVALPANQTPQITSTVSPKRTKSPIRSAPAPATSSVIPPRPAESKLPYDFSHESVLVVEDNIPNQKILKHMLEKLRCRVEIASNGFQAIEMACQDMYSIVFMDMYMPQCDGLTAVKQIRANYAAKGKTPPKLISFTGTYDPRLMNTVDDILLKPVNFDTLLKIVSKYCKNNFAPVEKG